MLRSLSSQSPFVARGWKYNSFFMKPHKKSKGVMSGDRICHRKGPLLAR